MDGWVVGWVDVWMDGVEWMVGWWMDGWMDSWGTKVMCHRAANVGCPSEVGSLYARRKRSTRHRDLGWGPPSVINYLHKDQVCPLWSMTQSENGRVLVKKLL